MNMKYKDGGMAKKKMDMEKPMGKKSSMEAEKMASGGEMKARGGGAATKGLKFKVCQMKKNIKKQDQNTPVAKPAKKMGTMPVQNGKITYVTKKDAAKKVMIA